jgi:hypothetical protein
MEKKAKIGLAVLIIAVVGIGSGVGIYFLVSPAVRGEVILTIWGDGTTGNFTLTMSELKSSKYRQFENLFYAYSNDRNGTYSGVSIKDILEKESLISGAVNFTFIASDGYNPVSKKHYFLNLTKLMESEYEDAIFAYGGDSFIMSGEDADGPIRAIINRTDVYPELSGFGAWWVSGCEQMVLLR